jgi:hypothetical protein
MAERIIANCLLWQLFDWFKFQEITFTRQFYFAKAKLTKWKKNRMLYLVCHSLHDTVGQVINNL